MAYNFDTIARTYDRLNHMMTFGLDRRWRRRAALAASDSEAVRTCGPEALDVACGTGDMVAALCSAPVRFEASACDVSDEMLAIARVKCGARYAKADAERLPYADGSFSAVSCAFGVRNFVHLEAGLREMARVLRPGGRMVILELATPDSRLLRPFYNLYTRRVIPWLGSLLAGSREAYTYLPRSIERFPKGEAFMALLREQGCRVWQEKLTFGVCRLYVADKD